MITLDTDYSKLYNNKTHNKHADFLPNNIRAMLSGSSGCGKTNLMLNLLLNGALDYHDVIIYTRTPNQDAYKYLQNFYANIQRKYKLNHKIFNIYDADDEIPDPSELDQSKSHIIIFDDVMTENQKIITDYFCQGRHSNCNVFYLNQSVHMTKKHGIRQNANVFILFAQDEKTLKYFYETYCSADMPFEEFKKFCEDAWLKNYGYIVINVDEKPESGKYIQNYSSIYIPEKHAKTFK